MRRFRFRLAPLLRLRTQLERASRRELATAMGRVAELEAQLEAAAQGVRDFGDQAVRTDAVGQLARGLEAGLRRHQWRVGKQKKDAQARLDVVRTDYAQKARELRTLERLREKQRNEWMVAVQKAEQAELDELARLGRLRAVATAGAEA
jgi:flagellar protein FliJ